ncbi:hypothetical protein Tco_0355120 [Tanacetum coccineum]
MAPLSQNSRPNFKVNGHRLKLFFGRDSLLYGDPESSKTFPKSNKFGLGQAKSDPKQAHSCRQPHAYLSLSVVVDCHDFEVSPKRISEKRTKNQAKTDKTKHGMEKRGRAKVKTKPKLSPPPFPTPHMGSCHLGNPFDVHWARKINGRDDLDWAPLKMNGQDDVELLLTKETHYMSCLSKQTQEEETRKKT